MKEVLLQLGGVDSIRAIQIGYEVIRVTFSSPVAFHQAKSMEGVHLFGFWCPILGGGPQPTMIHVFDFPFEGLDAAVEVALKAFGSVRGIRKKKPTSVIAQCLLALAWSLWSSRELYHVFFKLTATDVVSGTMGNHWYAIFVPNVGSVDNLAILHDNAPMLALVLGWRPPPPPSQKRLFPLFFLFLFPLYPRMSPSRGAPPVTFPQMRTPLLTAQAVSLRTPGRSFFRLFLKVSISTMSLPLSWLLPRWWTPQVRAQRCLLMMLMLVILTL